MILTLIDGVETMFLAVSLKAIEEDKPVSEFLEAHMAREKIPLILDQIQRFARSKLKHPVLHLALEEMDALLAAYQERDSRHHDLLWE